MAQVQATVGIKNSGFKSGLNEMREQAAQFGKDIKSTIAGAFAFGAVANFVTGFVKDMARVQDIADRLGITATEVQKVGNAAEQSGTNLETVIKVLTNLTMEAAKSGDAFAVLGINAADFANAGYEQQIIMLAGAYDAANGSQEKMIKLMTLLGAKGQDVLPLISQGAKAAAEQMDNLSNVSNGTVAAMARVDDMMTSLKQTTYGVADSFLQMGNSAMIAMKAIVQMMRASQSGEAGGFSNIGFVETFNSIRKKREEAEANEAKAKRQPLDAPADGKKAKDDAAKKTAEAIKSLAAEMAELTKSRMNDEEKITALKREQSDLEKAMKEQGATSDQRIEAQRRIIAITKEAEGLQKGINDKAQAAKDKAAKAAEDKSNATFEAESALAKKEAENARDAMTPQQRIALMKADQKRLMEDAKLTKDPESAAKIKLEALNIGDDIKKEQDQLDKDNKPKTPKAPGVVSSSLGAIGGGGGVFVASFDPALQEARRQTNLLQQIHNSLQSQQRTGTTHANPF